MSLLLFRKSGPKINWSFLGGSLPSALTFARASTAMYYNSSGVLTKAANNAPRFDYNPSTLALNGLLIEQQSTNLALQSSSVATSPWYTSGAAASNAATTGPDGTANSASSFTPTVLNGSINQAITVSGSTIYTFSVWLKQGTGNAANIKMQYYGGAYQASTITITSQWRRYSFTFTTPASPSTNTFSIVDSNASNWGSIYVYGAQVEALPFVTSYIPTAATAVTRAADSLVNTSISGWFNSTQGTMVVEALTQYVPTVNSNFAAFYMSSDNPFYKNAYKLEYTSAGSIKGELNKDPVYPSVVKSGYTPQLTKAVLAYGVGTSAITYNGLSAVTGINTNPTGHNTLSLGGNPTGESINGWLRSCKYWNTALTTTQLQQVTT